ncbi:MAG: xanthine phosphoribosyltransferase [Clostridia bacterium]|nr:xanthine phosphoribosyltransferase [Clostridia bacterium]
MELLKERILREGKVLSGDIVKVDGFLNHLVDVELMKELAREFRRRFSDERITKIVTVEASGIALGAICAQEFGVPMLFAKKAKSDNIEGGLLQSEIFSYTYKKKVTLIMSSQWISDADRVLIVDDFLANGEALRGLTEIVRAAGAEIAGIGIAIEKGFQGGGDKLRAVGYNVQSLAIIDGIEDGKVRFREDGAH